MEETAETAGQELNEDPKPYGLGEPSVEPTAPAAEVTVGPTHAEEMAGLQAKHDALTHKYDERERAYAGLGTPDEIRSRQGRLKGIDDALANASKVAPTEEETQAAEVSAFLRKNDKNYALLDEIPKVLALMKEQQWEKAGRGIWPYLEENSVSVPTDEAGAFLGAIEAQLTPQEVERISMTGDFGPIKRVLDQYYSKSRPQHDIFSKYLAAEAAPVQPQRPAASLPIPPRVSQGSGPPRQSTSPRNVDEAIAASKAALRAGG